MVLPTLNTEPGVCDLFHIRLPEGVQLSVAVGSVQLTVAEHDPDPAVRVILAGHPLITGAWVSLTVTVNEQVAVLLAASVTVS